MLMTDNQWPWFTHNGARVMGWVGTSRSRGGSPRGLQRWRWCFATEVATGHGSSLLGHASPGYIRLPSWVQGSSSYPFWGLWPRYQSCTSKTWSVRPADRSLSFTYTITVIIPMWKFMMGLGNNNQKMKQLVLTQNFHSSIAMFHLVMLGACGYPNMLAVTWVTIPLGILWPLAVEPHIAGCISVARLQT